MAYSEVEIVNLALGELGKTPIRDFSISDTDPITGRLTQRMYKFCRDKLIGLHDWSFARCTVTLRKKDEEHPEGVVYSLPSDCFVPRRLGPRMGAPNRWSVEGRNVIIPFSRISSVGDAPILRYTKSVTNTAFFVPYFISALYLSIAAEIAMPLNQDVEIAGAMLKRARDEFNLARLIDSNVGCGDDDIEQDLLYDTFVVGDSPVETFSDGS